MSKLEIYGVRLVPNTSPEGIHVIYSPARSPLLLSTDTNPTHTKALSTWSLLWPSAPRIHIHTRKLSPHAPYFVERPNLQSQSLFPSCISFLQGMASIGNRNHVGGTSFYSLLLSNSNLISCNLDEPSQSVLLTTCDLALLPSICRLFSCRSHFEELI